MNELTLNVIMPTAKADTVICDSVRLEVCDGANGKGGGSYGIRKGHVKAVIALQKGKIQAFLKGERVFVAEAQDGFAEVDNNTVTIVTKKYSVLND